MTDWLNRTHLGDCRDLMRRMAADGVKVQCVVTSPPYYGLRDYGVAGQIGLEPTLYEWVDTMVEVFACMWDVLADDGVLWLNLGDSYASAGGAGWQGKNGQRADRRFTASRNTVGLRNATRRPPEGIKAKDLMGQPWRVAFALQDAGWYLRSEVIWHKPSPMPESVKDRPTKAHEQIFLLTKSPRYYFDAEAVREKTSGGAHNRGTGVNPKSVTGHAKGAGSHSAKDHARARDGLKDSTKFGRGAGWRARQNESFSAAVKDVVDTRMARTVWTIPAEPFPGGHFATFPQALVARCVLAGTKPGDVVLDPFMGSGTVGQVATDLARRFIGCELNQDYIDMHELRRTTMGMPI